MFVPKARKIYKVLNSSCEVHILDARNVSETEVKLWTRWVTKQGHIVDMSIDAVELKNIQHWQEIGDIDDLLSR